MFRVLTKLNKPRFPNILGNVPGLNFVVITDGFPTEIEFLIKIPDELPRDYGILTQNLKKVHK